MPEGIDVVAISLTNPNVVAVLESFITLQADGSQTISTVTSLPAGPWALHLRYFNDYYYGQVITGASIAVLQIMK